MRVCARSRACSSRGNSNWSGNAQGKNPCGDSTNASENGGTCGSDGGGSNGRVCIWNAHGVGSSGGGLSIVWVPRVVKHGVVAERRSHPVQYRLGMGHLPHATRLIVDAVTRERHVDGELDGA